MAGKFAVLFIVFILKYCNFTDAVPEPGIKTLYFNKGIIVHGFSKSLFKDANIYIKGDYTNSTKGKPIKLKLEWSLHVSECAQLFPAMTSRDVESITAGQVKPVFKGTTFDLRKGYIILESHGPFSLPFVMESPKLRSTIKPTDGIVGTLNATEVPHGQRKKRSAENKNDKLLTQLFKGKTHLKPNTSRTMVSKVTILPSPSPTVLKTTTKKAEVSTTLKTEEPTTHKKLKNKKAHSSINLKGLAVKAPNDGNYLLLIRVTPVYRTDEGKPYNVEVEVKMKSATGYLSAAEWPLLPFYGAMSLVYLAYGVIWLIVSACQWRELLRIQFWIGGVIALGMLEKAIFFSEYNNVNIDGIPAHGLVVFAQVLSCIKRTLSRILIIIVSMGFGIVKPRLGAALHRVLGVASLYFILCVIEGAYRAASVTADVSKKLLLAAVPLSVLDAVICWWIFMALMQTMRTLRIRKNVVKLTIYRHFINILVVSVIASVAFMIWAIKYHHLNACIKDWKELWIDDAFWHFLFAIVLLAIMVLWRPTASNQRYAFTPLVDVGDEDDDDMTLSDAFHGMKMRGGNHGDMPTNRAEKMRIKQQDDLKWVEENIPTAGGIDTVLPSLLDSDEEVMTTKLEMSKME